MSQTVDTRHHECCSTDKDAQKHVELHTKEEHPLRLLTHHSSAAASTHGLIRKLATERKPRFRGVMLEDRQTNIDVFDKRVATEDGLMNCQLQNLEE